VAVTSTVRLSAAMSSEAAESSWPMPVAAFPLIVPATSTPVRVSNAPAPVAIPVWPAPTADVCTSNLAPAP
jgi:hypothetical protein